MAFRIFDKNLGYVKGLEYNANGSERVSYTGKERAKVWETQTDAECFIRVWKDRAQDFYADACVVEPVVTGIIRPFNPHQLGTVMLFIASLYIVPILLALLTTNVFPHWALVTMVTLMTGLAVGGGILLRK